jgi:hypothetical protein
MVPNLGVIQDAPRETDGLNATIMLLSKDSASCPLVGMWDDHERLRPVRMAQQGGRNNLPFQDGEILLSPSEVSTGPNLLDVAVRSQVLQFGKYSQLITQLRQQLAAFVNVQSWLQVEIFSVHSHAPFILSFEHSDWRACHS